MTKYLLTLLVVTSLFACQRNNISSKSNTSKREKEQKSDAADALDAWSWTRTFPDGIYQTDKFTEAFADKQRQLATSRTPQNIPNWRALGPKNIGGRTLCLAFHPTNPDIMWIGSASGGLWKTTTGGIGQTAWERIATGFPVLGVSAIAVTSDAQTIYVGTGEVYANRNVGTGFGIRTQRGSYGIGILKSTDGGTTWRKSLDWSTGQLRGIQKIVINPRNQNTIFAATTEGVFRSYNAGATWQNVKNTPMAVDFDMTPNDTNRLFATFGSLNDTETGIFRSIDAGNTWTKLTDNLPTTYSGKTLISISKTDPSTIFASIANVLEQIGLYKSIDAGDHWVKLNNNDVAQYQGWYSHDVAVNPENSNMIIHVGIDVSVSLNGGLSFQEVSNSNGALLGRNPVGGSEGLANYIHADIHGVYFSPHNPNNVFMVSDGGVYRTNNAHLSPSTTITALNGGLQTTQFYANFSNSQQDSAWAIGGMQDNFSAIYDGQAAWTRVIYGDGMCTAIHPTNDSIMFGSWQYLNVMRSKDKGNTFLPVVMAPQKGVAQFNGPFEIAPSNPNIMYAGTDRLLKSTDGGLNFSSRGYPVIDSINSVNTLAINPNNTNTVFLSTFPTFATTPKMFKTMDGGVSFTRMQGLPNRIITDITYYPKDTNMIFITLGGFNSTHVFKTINGGATWQPSDIGLPNIPTNTIIFDPLYPQFGYVGNDLGVYFTADTGRTWQAFTNPQGVNLPEACLVMHLSISPVNRKLRAATHGNGVYEAALLLPQGFKTPVDTVFASATMETTNAPVKTNFYLKKTFLNDTIRISYNAFKAALTMPRLPLATGDVPDDAYPNATATVFNDTLYPFRITPSKTDQKQDGITTFDLALIARHILGNEFLNSPYKVLAADVSADDALDALDMIFIRRLILHQDTAFKRVPHWVFIPKTYDLVHTPLPLSSIQQSYYFNAYATRLPVPFEFVAVKMGDVNNSYMPGNISEFPRNIPEIRRKPLSFHVKNDVLKANKIYDIPIFISEKANLIGFQGTFTLPTEGVEILNFESSNLTNFTENNFHISKNDKTNKTTLTFSWNDNIDKIFNPNDVLFTLKIQPKQDIKLNKIIMLTNDLTPSRTFDEKGTERNIILNFDTDNAPIFTQPNPFSTETTLNFTLNTEGVMQYIIFDETGKKIYQKYEFFKSGTNFLRLDSAATGMLESGFYIFQLETPDGVKTIKLHKI